MAPNDKSKCLKRQALNKVNMCMKGCKNAFFIFTNMHTHKNTHQHFYLYHRTEQVSYFLFYMFSLSKYIICLCVGCM